jgi:hypothetical protein
MQDPDRIDFDFLILADRAEAIGGKLYMLGGAWNRIAVPELPGHPAEPFYIAAGISVPYSLTNRKFVFGFELVTSDGQAIGETLRINMNTGRPADLKPGASQRLVMAIGASPEFPSEGSYTFIGMIDEVPRGRAAFEVVQAQQLQIAA